MTDSASVSLDDLCRRIDSLMLRDRERLRRGMGGIRRRQRGKKPFDQSLSKLVDDLERSEATLRTRRERLPKIDYDPTLPITEKVDEITTALAAHQVIVVCGETGSGKSTQLPKICLAAGRGIVGMIGHTQPRRIAARSVAARIAEELGSQTGQAVGFKIRFTDATSPQTYIKLMTDGILLAETQSDRFLEQYDTLIIDEAHERSLNIDFLLGYVKRILPRRPDLRVIITSATIDAERFAEFFETGERGASAPRCVQTSHLPSTQERPTDRNLDSNQSPNFAPCHRGADAPRSPDEVPASLVPVIEVSGRTYPVEVRYRPPEPDESDGEVDWQRAAAEACEELAAEGPGDILVFMPTERDIRETARVLGGRTFAGDLKGRTTEILPLFGRLSEKEQNRVFQPHPHRRIVIATNVAESSLTVPGIHYVVDPGTARISRFSATSQVQRLPIEPISRASADQRQGRCGRIAPGICIRLYSAEDFAGRDRYTTPEILRTNLASVLLQMKTFDLGKIEEFPFLDPPNPSAIRTGLKTLFELGAIDEQEQLTGIGRKMGRLPVDPRIARMILAAVDEQCLEELLVIASALELRDPRDRPLDRQQAADEAHKKFQHERSDFLSLLKLWDFYSDLDEKLSTSKLRKACQQSFLSYNRMREWKDLHRQLRELVIDHGLKPTDRHNNEDAIHRAILCGLLANVALKGDGNEYTGAGGQKLFLWPGSVAFAGKPQWIMAAELVETTRRYARCVAPVQPQWIESAAAHLVKKSYSEPHWHDKSAATMAWEKVLLFGLPVVPRRRCPYGPIDPQASREMFIQHGLVEGHYQSRGEFQKQNAQLKEELEEWQAKLRQGGQFIAEETEYRFYDERLPTEVYDGPRFEKWRMQVEARHPRLLCFTKEDLLINPREAPRQNAFPDKLRIGTMEVPVEYHLEPGEEEDGVTITIPREGLNQLSQENLGWLVPGLLEEKVAALIKTLPKNLRILFVPVPETAREAVQLLDYGRGDLLSQLGAVLRKLSGEHVPVSAFEPDRLPPHLQFNVRVVGPNGKPLARGRDLDKLRRDVAEQVSKTVQQVDDRQWNREGITAWNFGDLPQRIELQRGGMTVVGFPMLVDQATAVALRLAESPTQADYETRRALVRVFLFSDAKRLQEQVRYFPKFDQLVLQASPLPDGQQFRQQLEWKLAELALFAEAFVPRNEAAWNAKLKQARNQLSVAVQDLAELLGPLLAGCHDVRRLVEQPHPPALTPLVTNLRDQWQRLVSPGFLMETPYPWLRQFPRYFKAMLLRWEKATAGGFQKDRKFQQQLDPHLRRLISALDEHQRTGKYNPHLVSYRWLLEEYRVSLFAQQLGTAVPVSEKRLNEVWRGIASF